MSCRIWVEEACFPYIQTIAILSTHRNIAHSLRHDTNISSRHPHHHNRNDQPPLHNPITIISNKSPITHHPQPRPVDLAHEPRNTERKERKEKRKTNEVMPMYVAMNQSQSLVSLYLLLRFLGISRLDSAFVVMPASKL